MRIPRYNYNRMNQFLQDDINKLLREGLSIDRDDVLFRFQSRLERSIGTALRRQEVMCVTSGTVKRSLGRMLGRHYAVGVSSGTAALQLSLIALGIGKGDEVITVPNTYIGTLLAISNAGARPVLVDVLPDTMLMDPEKIEEKITPKTKAIIPVHLYGQMARMDRIIKIAKKHRLHVIEDSAHSPLANYNGISQGEKTDAACYSFVPSKNLGAVTNGGMVITRNKKLFRKIDILRNPISDDPLVLKGHRTPCYLDWIQMVFVESKLKYLAGWIKKRRQIAEKYSRGLSSLPITLPCSDKNAYHTFCDYAIRLKDRDKLKGFLEHRGIQTAVHYSPALHLTKTYRHLGYREGDFPEAEKACSEVLSLPMNPFLTDGEVEYVIKNVRSFFKR